MRDASAMKLLAAGLVSLLVGVPVASVQSEPPAKDAKQSLNRASQHMQGFVMRLREGGDDPVKLLGQPLLSFGDPARANENGTLWAFGDSGRPLAILELFQFTDSDETWVHTVTLTSPQRVQMKAPSSAVWSPEKPQIEPAVIPGGATPAADKAACLRQMKDLARRFTAHEFWDPANSRFELRLLVRPIHRYHDAAAGIQDGAAFILAHGTNPEVILLLEALGSTIAESRWHYCLARMGSAELHVELDETEVWKMDRSFGHAQAAYWLFRLPARIAE